MSENLPGDILRLEQYKRGLSGRAFARMLDINHMMLQRIVENKTMPKYRVWEKIARKLGKSVSDFFPPARVVRGFILTKVASKEAREKIAIETRDLPGVNVIYELKGNELIVDTWAGSPKQLGVFVLSLMNDYRDVVSETSTMIVFEQLRPSEEDVEVHPAQRSRQKLRELKREGWRKSSWYEVDVRYEAQQAVVNVISEFPESQEIYTVSGNTDILCRCNADKRKTLQALGESLEDRKDVSKVVEHPIIRMYPTRKILKITQTCRELMADVRKEFDEDPESFERLPVSGLEEIVDQLDKVSAEASSLRRLIKEYKKHVQKKLKGRTR